LVFRRGGGSVGRLEGENPLVRKRRSSGCLKGRELARLAGVPPWPGKGGAEEGVRAELGREEKFVVRVILSDACEARRTANGGNLVRRKVVVNVGKESRYRVVFWTAWGVHNRE